MTTKVDNIIKAYANDLEGLTRQECLGEDFSEKQCKILVDALASGTGAGGLITPGEKNFLEQAGFAKDFIQDLAGIDGKKALHSRVKWLGENINTKWYRLDYSLHQRVLMIRELEDMGGFAEEAIPSLTELTDALENEGFEIKQYAAHAINRIKKTIPDLINTLKNGAKHEQYEAAVELGNIGPEAKAAIPALINAFKNNQNSATSYFAAEALQEIGKEAVPALIDELKDKDKYVRQFAAGALGNIGKPAFFAIPVLQEMAANDPEPMCRSAAQAALNKMMEEIR